MESLNHLNIQSNTSGYRCKSCDKTYTRKTAFQTHIVLCEFVHLSKRERKLDLEETVTELPSQLQMFKIIQHLALKYDKLEEKLGFLQEWIDKKKQKIDVLAWLSCNNPCPDITFTELATKLIITQENITLLHDNPFQHVLQVIFNNTFASYHSTKLPIACFTQKTKMYKFNDGIWSELTSEELISLFNIIQNRLIHELREWKKENQDKMDSSDKLCDLYSKSLIKLMISFKEDAVYSKSRQTLTNLVKIHL